VRLRLVIHGAVQGVGFRPFVYRLARELDLGGWVGNTAQGVLIEIEGETAQVAAFRLRVGGECPSPARVQSLEPAYLDPVGFDGFEIRSSHVVGPRTTPIMPDIATCPECLREVMDPADRRYRYPFTNCTHCGPRYTIIEDLPYDRPHTAMRAFTMCPQCRGEYDSPTDRRFHAQPNACPECGPQLAWWDRGGQVLARGDGALTQAVAALLRGDTVAVKGVGGFHLMVDARQEAAVAHLRQAKNREEKPLALMYPDLEQVRGHCFVSDLEAGLLQSPEAPIVLLTRRPGDRLAPGVAPGNPRFGVMLPYTPLHHLLLADVGSPVVATSGNLADEPICTDETDARERLGGIAGFFLVHDRPIVRHVDDSIVRVVGARELVLRRARGYAPLPIRLGSPAPCTLAVGGHLKSAAALAIGQQVFVSQHLGDLETAEAHAALDRTLDDLSRLYRARPTVVACDLHPDYASTQLARQRADAGGVPLHPVQHHYAHVRACMAENELQPPVLGISWDGAGYGLDGTVWGGEFLAVGKAAPGDSAPEQEFERLAHLRHFRLPGGDAAVREPRRAAIGLLYELFGEAAVDLADLPPLLDLSPEKLQVLVRMLQRGANAPITSSAGRLFDAVAAILGLRQESRYEGQAAMELEFAIGDAGEGRSYQIPLCEPADGAPSACRIADWGPMVRSLVADARARVPVAAMARGFHDALVELMLAVAQRAGLERVALTGGCFQNAYLAEHAVERLRDGGFRPYWHQRIPPNDGGIALGQIAAVLAQGPAN